MTKQEARIILDALNEDDYMFCEISENDLMTFVNAKAGATKTPVARFLNDNNACLSGQIQWLKYATCEAAIRAAHRDHEYDALDWFLNVVDPEGCQSIVKDGEADAYYGGELRPVKDFIALIPAKYRTATETKKKAKHVRRRSR